MLGVPIKVLKSTMDDVMIRQNTCIGLAEESVGVMKQLVEHKCKHLRMI